MNGWVEEEEDPEMEEEEEDPEEDPEMEEEDEEMEADEQWDGPNWILPYQGADPLYPPPLVSDSKAEVESKAEAEDENEVETEAEDEAAPIPPHVPANPVPANPVLANPVPANPIPETTTIGTWRLIPFKRLFTDTQVWMGSSSSAAAAGHNPEDLTPSHIMSNLDALYRRYKEPPYALPETLLAPVTHNDPRDQYVAARDAATAPATDNDDSPTQKETSPSEPQGSPPRDS
ncbi:hypothetical protein Tco_1266322 [Tanacetum coccineum]